MQEESADSISNMSVEDLKNRALFITDIGRQSKRFKQAIQKQTEDSVVPEEGEDIEQGTQKNKQPAGKRNNKSDAYFIEMNKRFIINKIK